MQNVFWQHGIAKKCTRFCQIICILYLYILASSLYKVVEVLPVGVTAFISLSGLLPNSSCLPSSSLFKLVIVVIKGTWIKVRDNIQVAQTRNSCFHFSRKQTWYIKCHSWISFISFVLDFQWSECYESKIYAVKINCECLQRNWPDRRQGG